MIYGSRGKSCASELAKTPPVERRYRESGHRAHNKLWRAFVHDPYIRIMIRLPSLSPSVEAALSDREPSQAKRVICETRRG